MSLWDWPCACGGTVRADPLDPAPGVRVHQHTAKHRAWSVYVFGPLPDATAATLRVDVSAQLSVRPARQRRWSKAAVR